MNRLNGKNEEDRRIYERSARLLLLLALAAAMAVRFGKIRPIAGKLNTPYLLWLVFAGVLNISIYILNK